MRFFESPCLRVGILRARSSRYKTKSRPSGKLQCADLPVCWLKQAQLVLRFYACLLLRADLIPDAITQGTKNQGRALAYDIWHECAQITMEVILSGVHLKKCRYHHMSHIQSSFWTRIGRIQKHLTRYQRKKGNTSKNLVHLCYTTLTLAAVTCTLGHYLTCPQEYPASRSWHVAASLSSCKCHPDDDFLILFGGLTKHNLSIKPVKSKSFSRGRAG